MMLMFMRRLLWLIISSLQVLSVANAADYSLGYDAATSYLYTDNVNGSSSDPVSANAGIVNTGFKVKRTTENHELDIDLGLDFYDYNIEGYNTQNQDLQIRDQYRLERHTFTLNAGLVRDSTNTSEEFREQADVRTEFSSDRSETSDFSAGWDYQLTEANRLTLNASRTDINYDSSDEVGYRSDAYSASISEIFSETTYVFLQLNHNTSDSDLNEIFPGLASTQQSSNTDGLALGLNYSPTEQLLFNGYAGKSTVQTDPNAQDESGFCDTIFADRFPQCFYLQNTQETEVDTTYADIGVTWTDEVWDVKAGFNRSQQPDSNGELLEYDRWSTSGTYKIDEKNRITASLVYRLSSGVVPVPGEDPGDRDYWDYSLRWSLQLTQVWSFFSAVNFYESTQPNRAGGDLVTETWRYSVGISYSPIASHWSR